MCETFAYLRRNCKLFLPSQGSQKAYIIFLTLRLKKKINHHSSRIEFRQLETRAQVPISTILLFSTSSIRLLKNTTVYLATCGCWQIPKTFGRVLKIHENILICSNGFPKIFFCAANQRKWKEVRIQICECENNDLSRKSKSWLGSVFYSLRSTM